MPYLPSSLAQVFANKAPEFKAAFVLGVNDEGDLWFDFCGVQRKDILWALEKAKLELLSDGIIK